MGKIIAVSLSEERGTVKKQVEKAILREEHGLVGDSHAKTARQVSLLAKESLDAAKKAGTTVVSDNHGENFTTSGIDLKNLPVGTKLALGDTAVLEITQIGKEIHESPIFLEVKNHILPNEGVFAKVLIGGEVKKGDDIEILKP